MRIVIILEVHYGNSLEGKSLGNIERKFFPSIIYVHNSKPPLFSCVHKNLKNGGTAIKEFFCMKFLIFCYYRI